MKTLLFFFLSLPLFALELKFTDKVIFDRKAQIDHVEIGGLSGAYLKQDSLFVVSDDRGEHGPPRLFEFSLDLNKKPITITPKKAIILRDENGKSFETGTVDFEGISGVANGNFLISTEGDNQKTPRIPPQILEFSPQGILLKRYLPPAKFIPESLGTISKGIQNNLSLESLTVDNSGKTITTANEAPLTQDLIPGDKQFLRIIKLLPSNGMLTNLRESLYPIDYMQGNNGLVDLYHFDNERIITLERSWDPIAKKNKIQIFLIKQDFDNAPNYNKLFSIRNLKVVPLKKEKIFDLDHLVTNKQIDHLDNFEAITVGPNLKNGNKTLILISDNNFSVKQRTIFLIFEITKS